MIQTALTAGRWFFTGRMFSDNRAMARRFAIGVGSGTAIVIAVGQVAPLWLATAAGGALAGFLQPLLFKHLKYA